MRAAKVYGRNGYSIYRECWTGTPADVDKKCSKQIVFRVYHHNFAVAQYANLALCKLAISNMLKMAK